MIVVRSAGTSAILPSASTRSSVVGICVMTSLCLFRIGRVAKISASNVMYLYPALSLAASRPSAVGSSACAAIRASASADTLPRPLDRADDLAVLLVHGAVLVPPLAPAPRWKDQVVHRERAFVVLKRRAVTALLRAQV